MKKLFYSLGMCLLVVACKQSPNQLILTGTGTSAAGDIYVYSMAGNDEPIDTIKVSDGNFTYIMDIAGEPLLLVLSDNAAFTRYVVAEKGSISLAGDTALFKGSPLNDRLSSFFEAYSHSAMDVDEKKSAIIETSIREDKELTEAQIAELEALEREEADLVSVVIKKHYEMDKATVVGVFELMCAQRYVSDEDFEAMYEQGGEAIKNFPPFAEMFKIKDVRDKTKVGAKYIDFEGVNPKNTAQTIRVSDFVGKNNYVLLDFWASWCGPCRKAMPEIKKLNDKYAHKGLEIVGVVVNDKLEAHLQAANSLNITWTQLFDNQNESSALYGIDGIPTLILLDKDGTILARTYDKAEIVEKIQSLLGK